MISDLSIQKLLCGRPTEEGDTKDEKNKEKGYLGKDLMLNLPSIYRYTFVDRANWGSLHRFSNWFILKVS